MSDEGSIFVDGSNDQLAAIPATDPAMQPERSDIENQPPPENRTPQSNNRVLEEDEAEVGSDFGQTMADETERKLMDEDKTDTSKNRKKAGLLCVLCLAFIGILVALIIFFTPDTGAAARDQFDGTFAPSKAPTYFPTESTEAPTLAPIEETQSTLAPTRNPTESPTPEDGPTPFPSTASPTVFPTNEQGEGELSRLPCDEIKTQANVTEGTFGENNFKLYDFQDKQVCGDTFGGKDPERPQRSHWSVRYGRRDCPALDYQEGFELCDHVGARWCSVDEYLAGVALGTGCGGDRQMVWTNTRCTTNGQSGRVMFDLGLRDPKQPFTTCEPDLNTLSPIRCCGDNF